MGLPISLFCGGERGSEAWENTVSLMVEQSSGSPKMVLRKEQSPIDTSKKFKGDNVFIICNGLMMKGSTYQHSFFQE